MSLSTDTATRQAFITGLRDLARYLDQHPAVPVPAYGTVIYLSAASAEDFVALGAIGRAPTSALAEPR